MREDLSKIEIVARELVPVLRNEREMTLTEAEVSFLFKCSKVRCTDEGSAVEEYLGIKAGRFVGGNGLGADLQCLDPQPRSTYAAYTFCFSVRVLLR